jgi:hypothetical protein
MAYDGVGVSNWFELNANGGYVTSKLERATRIYAHKDTLLQHWLLTAIYKQRNNLGGSGPSKDL